MSTNAKAITFPANNGAGNVTVTHIGIVEGANPTDPTATLLYSEALPTPKTLTVNDIYAVRSQGASGDFTLTLV